MWGRGRRVRPDRGQLPEALPENADQTLQLPSCAAPYREIYTLWGTERGSRLRGHRGAEGSEPYNGGQYHEVPDGLPDLVHFQGIPGGRTGGTPHRGEPSH